MRPVAAPPPQTTEGGLSSRRIVMLIVVVLVGLSLTSQSPAFLLITAIAVVMLLRPSFTSRNRQGREVTNFKNQIQVNQQLYNRDYALWQQEWYTHNQREEARLAQRDIWFPVTLGPLVDRLDIIGGVTGAWQYALISFGAGLLAEGYQVTVLDFTGESHGIAAGLAKTAAERIETRTARLQELDLLTGLPAAAAADVLADALGTLHGKRDAATTAADADILRAVLSRLDGSFTLTRIAAALRLLTRNREQADSLSIEEQTRLTYYIDEVGSSPAAEERVRGLRIAVELVLEYQSAGDEADSATFDDLTSESPFVEIRSAGGRPRARESAERILVESIVDGLESANTPSRRRALVIGPADHINPVTLERLTDAARQHNMLLVILFKHLRDDVVRLVGTGRSATAFMRLGNYAEATAAAEHIGRGHEYVLSQLTHQVGINDSESTGNSWGSSSAEQDGLSVNNTSGVSSSASSGETISHTLSTSAQATQNWSRGRSVSDGTTVGREYAFKIEPTELQQLAPTAFILVQGSGGGRRAVVGDCHPAIGLSGVRVSPTSVMSGPVV